jgi:methylated-DNA-protein-cysteine methyltransferase related protein
VRGRVAAHLSPLETRFMTLSDRVPVKRKSQSFRLRKSSWQKRNAKPGDMRLRIEQSIRSIPRGKVSTYGAVAKAAGFPGAARHVAATLRRSFGLPWQRVLGSGGEIKLTGDSAIEQRLRLEAEGVRFRGRKVDMKQCEFKFGRDLSKKR